LSTIKIKPEDEILEMLKGWVVHHMPISSLWLCPTDNRMFLSNQFSYCGKRIRVEDRQNTISKINDFDYSDLEERFFWSKEWTDRR